MIQPILKIGAQRRKFLYRSRYGKANYSCQYPFSLLITSSVYTFTVYIGSAIYAPSIPGVMADFDVSETVASLGLALYVLSCKISFQLYLSTTTDINE